MTDTITIALAALAGDPVQLDTLLKQRATEFFKCDLSELVNTKLLGFVTPLSCAARSGSKACVDLLLNADGGKLKPQFHYKHYQDTVEQGLIQRWWTALGDKTFIMSPLHYAFGIDTIFPLFLERAIHEHDQTQAVGNRFYEQPATVFRLMFSLAQFAIWLTSKNLPAPDYEKMYAQGQAMIAQLNATTKGADTARNSFIHTLISTSAQTFASTWSASTIEHNSLSNRHYISYGTPKDILIKHMDDALVLSMRMGLLPNANIANLIRRAAVQGLDNTAEFLKNHFPKDAEIVSTSLPMTYAEYRWLFERTPLGNAKNALLYDYPRTPLSPTTGTQKPTASSSMPSNAEQVDEKAALQEQVATLKQELKDMQAQMTQMAQVLSTLTPLPANSMPTYSSSMGPSSSTMSTSYQSPVPHYGSHYMMPQMPYGYPASNPYLPSGGLYPVPGMYSSAPASYPPSQSPSFIPLVDTAAPAPSTDSAQLPALSATSQNLWHTAPASLPVAASSQLAVDSLPRQDVIAPTN